ncbi:hypothetical protein Gogos_003613 [Gossypium gossypioides]|uniref:Uncharacterized protein n=1 Tax=Gossypium gossypioides TaxID=34282 RepID=A0A7J9CNE2_GOSGO|nr:hypothetical protein [Gossypium gossypioides]
MSQGLTTIEDPSSEGNNRESSLSNMRVSMQEANTGGFSLKAVEKEKDASIDVIHAWRKAHCSLLQLCPCDIGLRVSSMMITKSFVAIFLTLLLILAIMEADGKRIALEKEREPSNHQLGRKAGVGVKDDIDLTANVGAGEDDSDVALFASLNAVTTAPQRHHFYPNERH